MRAFLLLATLVIGVSTHGQGTILFNNRTGPIDAPISGPDGRGFGEYGGIAQLYLVNPGGVYTPLSPSTTFRDTSPAAAFYLNAVSVTVPNIPAGSQATVIVRTWVGPTFEQGIYRGESSPVTVTLGGLPPGGGAPIPDGLLIGLQGYVGAVPEPSTLALGAVGAVLLLARRRTS